jgi:hypothetical protein
MSTADLGHVQCLTPEDDAPQTACSLIPGLGVKLSVIILAGSMVLSAVRTSLPHDGAD